MIEERLQQVYDAYNGRDVEALLSFTSATVDWPDGERRLRGRDELRAYWLAQWDRTVTEDRLAAVARLSDTVAVTRIEQVVRTIDGHVLSRGGFVHVLRFDGPSIARLDIVPLCATDVPAHHR